MDDAIDIDIHAPTLQEAQTLYDQGTCLGTLRINGLEFPIIKIALAPGKFLLYGYLPAAPSELRGVIDIFDCFGNLVHVGKSFQDLGRGLGSVILTKVLTLIVESHES